MSRYTGPVEKIERRFGVNLDMKGERRIAGKCSINSRKYGPGQHGQNIGKISEYGMQLREKQKAKFMYGISEKQFRLIFNKANRIEGNTGDNLIILLERRLDNLVYRMGLASTRRFSRQLVIHGHILVDGNRMDIPSYFVKVGQKISIKDKSTTNKQIVRSLELAKQSGIVPWINLSESEFSGLLTRLPSRDEVVLPIEERLIIELYSK